MCYDSGSRPPIQPISGGSTGGADLVLTASDGSRLSAYEAHSTHPGSAQVLILPDVRGLHQFYKDLADRFAENGFPALALDYFGRTAGITPRDDVFDHQPHVAAMQLPTFLLDVEAAVARLQSESARPIFIVGFCRGGSLGLLAATEPLPLAGAIVFYAGLSRTIPGSDGPVLEQAVHIRIPILGLFGGADQGIPPTDVHQLDLQLDRAGVSHELVSYPGAPHSFFDRRYVEFAGASADAWQRVLRFLRANSQASPA